MISRGRLVILPSNDEGDRDTDEDSGDENELLPNNLNRSQLLVGSTVDHSTSSGNISVGIGDEEEVEDIRKKRSSILTSPFFYPKKICFFITHEDKQNIKKLINLKTWRDMG